MMWDWVREMFDQAIEGLKLILQGSMLLLPVVVGLLLLVVLVRWFFKEPKQFLRGWVGLFVALVFFPAGPVLIDRYVYPVGKDSWMFLPVGIGCAYLAYKVFVLVAGLKEDVSGNGDDEGAEQ